MSQAFSGSLRGLGPQPVQDIALALLRPLHSQRLAIAEALATRNPALSERCAADDSPGQSPSGHGGSSLYGVRP